MSELARLCGWRHHRCGAGSGTPSGEPDGFPTETLVRGDRLLFGFVLGARGRLTPLERGWLEALAEVRRVEVEIFEAGERASIAQSLLPADAGADA